ncbi:DUF7793 family protein [Winogradskyella rapida]|uniref:DUF7793 domain-containing protein n=1 Tax=Winogradskyella rapida TaxID=549701 RepID=A0ABW3KSC1_9FLAO
MKTYKLSFGEISILNPKLAEVIINEGVIMDVDMVVDYHKFLMDHLEAPFALLVNKKHSYTYTFEAQKNIVNHDVTKAIAVVNKVYASKLATDVLININRESKWNIKTFREREEALKWLEEQA